MDKNVWKVEELDTEKLVMVLERWNMEEFVDFVKVKQMDGRKLLEVTEGIVKLWRPKVNAKKFIYFVQDLKINPEKYLQIKHSDNSMEIKMENSNASLENQYQTVFVKKAKEEHFAASTVNGVEEILKKIVPAKSFLYRHQGKKSDKVASSYLPMDAGIPKKSRNFFRLSSYEHPNFDLKLRFSKADNFNDRGYYSIKTNSRYCIQKTFRNPESKPKYKSMSTAEDLNDKVFEDHFYEDLCYNDVESDKENKSKGEQLEVFQPTVVNVKPCIAKIQELFQSFKLPFFKRNDEAIEENKDNEKRIDNNVKPLEVAMGENEKDIHLYENSDSIANMYDSVHVKPENVENVEAQLPVEDYLEPIQASKDYCDVNYRQKDESLLSYILSIFETRFGIRRETNESNQLGDSEDDKDADTSENQQWNDAWKRKSNMADRPLPVPVENEPYYMNIDRGEAENLLKGQPDGTFVLRPSSQPNHAYTLSVSCGNAVHNVGIRRRSDGRIALGFARRGERSFVSITALLRHHRRRRLLLVAGGGLIGATTLNEPPHYYQTPSNIPVSF